VLGDSFNRQLFRVGVDHSRLFMTRR